MTTVSSKTYTFTNGTANDATPVESEFTTLFANDATLAADLTEVRDSNFTFTGIKQFTSPPKADQIDEKTAGSGVTADGVRHQDGYVNIASIRATISSVDTSTDVITCSAAHGLSTADPVKVRAVPGATLDTGLSASTIYYWRTVAATTGTLHPTASDASGNTNTVNITAQGSGTRHIIGTPSSPAEHDVWMDANGLNMRYGGSTTTLGGAVTAVNARSSNTIMAAGDKGALFVFTSTFTQTLTAAATLGSKWFCYVRNDGTGVITLDPNSSETIDGATTMKMYPGEAFTIICDGSNFKTIGRQRGEVLLEAKTASASSSIDFTSYIDDGFDEYVIKMQDVLVATDSVGLWFRVSEDAGSNWQADASDYDYWTTQGGGAQAGSTGAAQYLVSQDPIRTTFSNARVSGKIIVNGPSYSGYHKNIETILHFPNTGAQLQTVHGVGRYIGATNAINGFRIMASSGNITSGYFRLYGVRKS